MFDPTAEADEKLRTLRSDFEACIDAAQDAQNEAHRAARFYHNTKNEGQWEAGDLQALREQGRVAFSFNVIKPKVDTFLGMVEEQRRAPHASAIGGEDALTAEVLNSISERAYDIADLETLEAETLKEGTIKGQHSVRIEVEPDPENPLHQLIVGRLIPRFELDWDPASRRPDRSDARYVFWHKWLGKAEFERTYPKFEFDDLLHKADTDNAHERLEDDRSESGPFYGSYNDDMYDSSRWEPDYYNAQRDKLRVIHAEYRVPTKRHFLVDPQSGISQEVDEKFVASLGQYQEAGYLVGLTPASTWTDTIYSVQFVGNEILYDAELDQPYDGFSFVPFTYAIDSETGHAYGMLRNFFDPQMEINKAHSLSLENLAGQNRQGMIAEKSAVTDPDVLEDQLKTTASIAIVEDGALTQGKIKDRAPAQSSPAISQRLSDGVAMLDKVSNIHTDETTPAGQAEAVGTVQLRHRKSQLSMSDVVKSYEKFQKGVALRVMQVIVRAMPDSQIAEYLGNSKKYQVQQGTVIEIDAATGQPKGMAQLQDLRTLRHDVRLETSSENVTSRIMESQSMKDLQSTGFPVDPVVAVELSTGNRSLRERLKAYAEQAQKAAQEQKQREAEAMQNAAQRSDAQIQSTIAIAGGEAQEKRRHNQATEQLNFMKQQGDHAVRLAGVLEKADAGEKAAIVKLAELLERRQMQRESIQAHSTRREFNG